MTEEKVYFIMESEDYDDYHYGFAFSEESISPLEIQSWDMEKEWTKLKMELRNGSFPDYLVNDLDIPLCSEKLKQIIESKAKNASDILWYPIVVSDRKSERTYYYLKLKLVLSDIIDVDNSLKDNDMVYSPVFYGDRIRDIFICDCDESYLFVSESLKKEIEQHRITGLGFETW